MAALSAVQSFARILVHTVILLNSANCSKLHWLTGRPYLVIISSNDFWSGNMSEDRSSYTWTNCTASSYLGVISWMWANRTWVDGWGPCPQRGCFVSADVYMLHDVVSVERYLYWLLSQSMQRKLPFVIRSFVSATIISLTWGQWSTEPQAFPPGGT